jgi:hypothetical protein
MVFNTTFNNISVISWSAVLSVEETEISLTFVLLLWSVIPNLPFQEEGRRGHDRMVVGFTTTYANSAFPGYCLKNIYIRNLIYLV